MTFISYAQNREDVLLHRLFGNKSSGFYVDVGACDPVELSITKHFSDLGWTGLNFEPSPTQYPKVAAGRPRDINLNVAVSSKSGEMTFYRARGNATGLSTLVGSEVEIHEKNGFKFDRLPVQVVTLAEALAAHVGERTIDFMTIDVEGHEKDVIAGGDWKKFRPRVVVVESTRPLSTEQTHHRWEDILLAADYLYATFDGLNRYYVRKEDEQLVPLLQTPPNVFDDFIPWEYQKQIDALKAELAAFHSSHRLFSTAARPVRWMLSRLRR